MKLIIEYDPINGESVPDGKIHTWLKGKIISAKTSEFPLAVITSSSLVIEEARALISEHILSNEDIVFNFKKEMLYPDEFGMLDHWPGGFCDAFENVLERLI